LATFLKTQKTSDLIQTAHLGVMLDNAANNKTNQNLQDQLKELRGQINTKNEELKKKNEDLQKKNEEIVRLRDGVQEAKIRLEEAKAMIVKQEGAIQSLKQETSFLKHEVAAKDYQIRILNSNLSKYKLALIVVSVVAIGLTIEALLPLFSK
jgi:chromosome segregation ATPase